MKKAKKEFESLCIIGPRDLALNYVDFSAAGMLAVTSLELRWIGGELT